ncbi:hypothetical protein TWF506_003233 [Arthrobotrys conoides]|uniref:Uncharacterized protein n=1 Tax=Arthrobotrys conoides TaxID=74498 RepID=A0AAN8N4N5_9PEZI
MGKTKKAKGKAKKAKRIQERSDEIADDPAEERRVQAGPSQPTAAGETESGPSDSLPAPNLPSGFAEAMHAWEIATGYHEFFPAESGSSMLPSERDFESANDELTEKEAAAKLVDEAAASEAAEEEENRAAALKAKKVRFDTAMKAAQERYAAFSKMKREKEAAAIKMRREKEAADLKAWQEKEAAAWKANHPMAWLEPCKPIPPPTRSVKSMANEAAQKIYDLAEAKARHNTTMSSMSSQPRSSAVPSYQQKHLAPLLSTASLVHGLKFARSPVIQNRYVGLVQTLVNTDLAALDKFKTELTTMVSAISDVEANPDNPELQIQLRATANTSQGMLTGILQGKSQEYLSGFLEAITWSTRLEEIQATRQKEACMRAGIRVAPKRGPLGDPSTWLWKVPTMRQEFIKQMARASLHLSKTLFDNNLIDDDKVLKMWLDDGEIRWAELEEKSSDPQFATLTKRFSRTHPCVGIDKDVHETCLSCIMEMKWEDLLDFAPALGLPSIRRPKGWKPLTDEDSEIASGVELPTVVDEDSLNIPSEPSDLVPQELDKEPQVTEASTEPQAGKKKKKNKKKKKKTTSTEVNEESHLTETSSQLSEASTSVPIQESSVGSASLSMIPEYSRNGVPSVAEGDGKSVEFEYVTGPAAKAIHEQYKKFLPTAIPDDAKFKFSGHGQPEREISGKEMRAILHKEMLACNNEDPEFTTAILQSIMPNANVDEPTSTKKKGKAVAKAPVASEPIESVTAQLEEPPVKTPKAKAKAKSSKPKGMTPLEEYNMLRAQRLELALGIGRFVLESICAGKRPCFDVSLDGRIEFGHADLLYPIRMMRAGYDDTTDQNPPSSVGIDTDYTEVKMVTAPIVSIRDKETPDIGDGMINVIRDFQCPNVIAIQDMFRNVDMVRTTIADVEGEVDRTGTASGGDKESGNPVPKGTTFGLKTSVKRAKAKAEAGEPVFLGSQKYQILPSDGPQGEHAFDNIRPLTKTFCRALDICEDTQTWIKNQKRNIAVRDILGDDPLWPVNPGVPRKPIDGSDCKPATKPAPNKPVPVKKPENEEAGKLADLVKELNDKEQMAAMMAVERDEMLALMEQFHPGRKRTEWGFEASLKTMNECLEGIEANNRNVKALIEKTLRDHPWPPGEGS